MLRKFILFPLILLLVGCAESTDDKRADMEPGKSQNIDSSGDESETKRTTDSGSLLAAYDLDNESPDEVPLPKSLHELSGLAVTEDGHLFGHNDEDGVVFEISRDGTTEKKFFVGSITIAEDFEGIEKVGNYFYLISSNGDLFEFPEAGDGERVDYTLYKTPLKSNNDLEGLCYDPTTKSLLLPCKEDPGDGVDGKDRKAIYEFSLETKKFNPSPRFILDEKEICDAIGSKTFKPSAIVRNNETGTFLILSSNDPAIIEIDATGNVLGMKKLKKSIHPQPEGIAFGPHGDLLIGNEGGKLISYPRK